MDIWVLCYFLYDDRRDSGLVEGAGGGGGGGCCPCCKKSMRGSFEI